MKNYRMLAMENMTIPYIEVRNLEGDIIYKGISPEEDGVNTELTTKDGKLVARVTYKCDDLKEESSVAIENEEAFTIIKKSGINKKRFDLEGTDYDLNETSWGFSYEVLLDEKIIGKFTIKGNITGIEVIDEDHEIKILAIALGTYKIVE